MTIRAAPGRPGSQTRLSSEAADDPRRVAGDDAVRRHVARDDAAGADDAAIADRYVWQHDRPAAEPDGVADADRTGCFPPGDTQSAVERVGPGIKLHRRAHLQIVADLDQGAIEKDTVVVDEGVLADADVVPVIAVKARLDVGAVVDRAKQLAQQCLAARRVVRRRRVVAREHTLSATALGDQLGVAGAIKL